MRSEWIEEKNCVWNNEDFDELLSQKSVRLIKYEEIVESEDRSVEWGSVNEQTGVLEQRAE